MAQIKDSLIIFGFIYFLFGITGVNGEPIKALTQPFPPFSIHLDKGQTTGLGVEIFHIISEEIGLSKSDYEVIPAPFKRIYSTLQREKNHIGIAIGRTKQREDLFQWVGPYTKINNGVFARKDSRIRIKNARQLKKYSIATIGNSAPEQALLKLGLSENQFQRSPDPNFNLVKLLNRRIQLMAHPAQSVSFMIYEKQLKPSDFDLVYTFNEHGLYFAFSKDFPKETVERFQTALDHFMTTKPYRELRRIYRLDQFSR